MRETHSVRDLEEREGGEVRARNIEPIRSIDGIHMNGPNYQSFRIYKHDVSSSNRFIFVVANTRRAGSTGGGERERDI